MKLWIVKCRVRDLDKVRRFAVVAESMGKAYDQVVAAGVHPALHDSWSASGSPYEDVLEIGAGGDVGVGGLS